MSEEREEREERDERLEGDLDDEWQVVRTVGSDEEATLIAGYLQANDVPTQVESLLFHQEPVSFGRMGEVRVRVPTEHAAEAERLLAERDARPLDDEADEAELAGEGGSAGGGDADAR